MEERERRLVRRRRELERNSMVEGNVVVVVVVWDCLFIVIFRLVWLYFGQKMIVVVFELWLYLRVGGVGVKIN